MRASYRRHRLWRSVTRTPVLVAALVAVVALVFALDKSHQPPGCQSVKSYQEYGSYTATRVCPKPGQTLKPQSGAPFRRQLAQAALLALIVPVGALLVLLAVRSWRALDIRRARRHG